MNEETRERLRGALANVACNAANYPQGVQYKVLGQDMSKFIDRLVEAVEQAL